MKKNYSYKVSVYSIIGIIVLLIILRLTNLIDWSWWWITAPIWIPFLIAVILVIAFFWLLGKYSSNQDDFTGL